jgi:hypothetical protein
MAQPRTQTIEELAARLEASCDREALLALSDLADPRARHVLGHHLDRCSACREASLWIDALGRLLPPVDESHPGSATLTAFVAGELAAEERARVAEHLASCPRCTLLRQGAEEGLAEAERVLAGLELAEAIAAGGAQTVAELHLPLELPRPPAPRALAAEPALEEPAPVPEDRRPLLELGDARVVYYRIGAEATVALFAKSAAELQLEVWLDDEPLSTTGEPELIRVSLGAAAELGGRRLRLDLRRGDERLRRSFTFVFGAGC